MRISTENNYRNKLITVSILLMIASLLISRAALSISIIIFICMTVIHKHTGQQIRNFIKDPVLIGISLLFAIPFISGLWSQNLSDWLDVVRIKLPLVLFPFAFAGSWKLSGKQWQAIAFFFIIIIVSGTCWSFVQYIKYPKEFQDAYLKAKTISTPLENDHVRFSWLITVGIMCCFIQLERIKERLVQIILILIIIFLSIYLHILSARTGLFSFYIFLGLYALRLLLKKNKVKESIILISVLILLPLLSWMILPTFQNRIKYFKYDFSYVKSHTYLPGSNDGSRMISIRAGWYVIKKHPFGAGAGDIRDEMDRWYPSNVPEMLSTDKFYPCSEWIMYGGFAGWPGMIAFTMILLIPFFYTPKTNHFYWTALNCIAAFSFVFDIGLENQYGTFIYSFIVLWWYKWLNHKQDVNNG